MQRWMLAVLLLCCTHASNAQADTTGVPHAETWALVSQSVLNIRREPDYRAEMTTQALLGTPLKLMAKTRGWTKVQTPEGYEGWTSAPLSPIDSLELHKRNKQPRVIVTDNNSFVYATANEHGEIVTEVVMGNILYLENFNAQKHLYKVALPDGRKGFINRAAVKKWNDWKTSILLTGTSIEKLSKRFLGVPYFWGGTSPRGLDCSGLTKTTYLMHGIILPRDARQQYLTGTPVDSAGSFSKLAKGDLLFFGRKDKTDSTKYNIIHTAIYLQNAQFIHANDGYVQINSLNPADKNYDKHNHSRYVAAKRILNQPVNGTWSIFEHPWYR
ncbi:NlpC/P60 family protein [Haoranjiania flava]|uniref:C40 family peptidase n=1 Tax=Haoranjiania flava TaxID=1856322 RepID=A0AAE3ISI9_9BACT|nr:C40 family peptidase [Haoranjiania flava]MCU7695012.1 C40 family peptidase [Haoranjiania flava]